MLQPSDFKDFLSITLNHNEQAFQSLKTETLNITVLGHGGVMIEPTTIKKTSLDLVLSCGVHGNETAPIELITQLIAQIVAGDIHLTCRVLFIFGHPAAMREQQRFLEYNLNRLFCGAHKQQTDTQEHRRAILLEQWLETFFVTTAPVGQRERVHYDLHTAIRGSVHEKFAIHPFVEQQDYSAAQIAWLFHSDIKAILFMDQQATTFSCHSAHQYGAHAFTMELGQVKPFGENDLTRLDALNQQLVILLSTGFPEQDLTCIQEMHLYKVQQSIYRQTETFTLSFADDLVNFTAFQLGDEFAVDATQRYNAVANNEVILFPNAKVQLGHRALLTAVEDRTLITQLCTTPN